MKYLAAKNFERFQHYRDRNPPWIKLYYALTDDNEFLALTEVQQIHLILIWLACSRHPDGRLPYDHSYIRAKIRAKRRVDLKALIAAGFLLVVDASTAGSPDARPDASTETSTKDASTGARPLEEDTEDKELLLPPREPSGAEAGIAARLPTDADRNALTALLVRVPRAESWLAAMGACLDGMPGHEHVTPAQLGQAIRDYVANGAEPNSRLFRRYLSSAKRESNGPPSGASPTRPRGGVAARTFVNAQRALEDLP